MVRPAVPLPACFLACTITLPDAEHKFAMPASQSRLASREHSVVPIMKWGAHLMVKRRADGRGASGCKCVRRWGGVRGACRPADHFRWLCYGKQIPISLRRHRSSRYAHTKQASGILVFRLGWTIWTSSLSNSCNSVALRTTLATIRTVEHLHRRKPGQRAPAQPS